MEFSNYQGSLPGGVFWTRHWPECFVCTISFNWKTALRGSTIVIAFLRWRDRDKKMKHLLLQSRPKRSPPPFKAGWRAGCSMRKGQEPCHWYFSPTSQMNPVWKPHKKTRRHTESLKAKVGKDKYCNTYTLSFKERTGYAWSPDISVEIKVLWASGSRCHGEPGGSARTWSLDLALKCPPPC